MDEAVAPISLVAMSQARDLLISLISTTCKAQMTVQNLADCCHPYIKKDFHTFCFPGCYSLVFRSPISPSGCSDHIHAVYTKSSFYICCWRSSSTLLLHLGAAWLKSTNLLQCCRPKEISAYCSGGTPGQRMFLNYPSHS